MQISEERRKRVIDLYFNQHKTYAEIAQIEHISPRDIHAIIKKEQARRQKHKDQQQSAKAYKLFSEGKTDVEVAIELNLPASKVIKLCREYWKLRGLDVLNTIYKETNGKIWLFLKLYKELIKKRGMSKEQVAKVVEIAIHKLPYMENLYQQAKDETENMQRTIQRLANDIAGLERKISLLDQTAFSSEQECKRTEQQLQELTAQKDILEKLIANILNGEGYTKINQIAKESVKAVLAENRKIISIAYTAIIQTLKDNPELINLIHNMPISKVNGHDDNNNNNISKYLGSNKDRIMDLAKKNYENLVEALTNNAIFEAADSLSSWPNNTLPSSSPGLPSTYDQSDIYRIENSETHHNSKGDIDD